MKNYQKTMIFTSFMMIMIGLGASDALRGVFAPIFQSHFRLNTVQLSMIITCLLYTSGRAPRASEDDGVNSARDMVPREKIRIYIKGEWRPTVMAVSYTHLSRIWALILSALKTWPACWFL